jgi:glycogen(starch) synthase
MHVLVTYLEGITSPQPGHSALLQLADMSASLTRQGVQVTVLTAGFDEQGPQHFGRNLVCLQAPLLSVIPITRLDEMRHAALLQCNLSLLATTISLWRRGIKVDLVHSVGWEAALASGLTCQMTGSPLVCTLEDAIWEREPWMADGKQAYPRYVERWLIRHCHRLVCPDQYMRDKIQDLFLVREEDLAVVPPFPERTSPHDERETRLQGKTQKILFIGPLGPRSGVADLLQACSQLAARKVQHLQIIMVTSANSANGFHARKMIRKLHLADRVLFVDQIGQRNDHEELYRQASLLVMPGRAEFVGNLVLAAMQNGLPVVAANCGALAELIEDGVNGMKFSFGDCKSLARAMETVLCNHELHRQMAAEARRKARSWPEVGPLLFKIYREACGRPLRLKRKGGETDDLLFPEPRSGGGA